MAVRAVVLDLDGTLLYQSTDTPVQGVSQMIDELRTADLRIAVASNRPLAEQRLTRAGLTPDLILDRQSVGASKGSVRWVDKALSQFQMESNEIVWLGDSDQDMRSAVNARIVYFNAGWSNPSYPYGINVQEPHLFSLIVRECFMKPLNWYWQLSYFDLMGRPITTKAMIDGDGAGIKELKNDLLSFLHDEGDPRVGPISVRDLMMYHLIGSIYGDGLYNRVDTWTTYPGHSGGPNQAMGQFILLAARLFRDRYLDDLFNRHTTAIDTSRSRVRGEDVEFANQIDTICLNQKYQSRIQNKTVVVVDDFTSWGFSCECARNLLFQAGASEVISVNIGKYGYRHHVINPISGYTWDPYVPTTHQPSQFTSQLTAGQTNPDALTVVRDSYRHVG